MPPGSFHVALLEKTCCKYDRLLHHQTASLGLMAMKCFGVIADIQHADV